MKPAVGPVSVQVVTWNHSDTIAQCLRSLLAQTHEVARIRVWDNASTDDSLDAVRSVMDDRIELTESRTNVGFARAHNAMLRDGATDYILLANPDMVFDPSYIAAALEGFSLGASVGCVCGLLFADETRTVVDGAGLRVTRSRHFQLVGHGGREEQIPTRPFEVFGADGAAPLYRRTTVVESSIGDEFYDPTFFAHKEDHDVAWRLRILGWRTVCVPQARAVHPRTFRPGDRALRRKLPPPVRMHAVKNQFLLLAKNDSLWALLRDAVFVGIRQLVTLVYVICFERSSLMAYPAAVRLLPKALAARREIGRRAKSSRDLKRWFGMDVEVIE